MTINSQKPISTINTCNALYDEEVLIKAILWFASEPVQSKKKVYMFGKYPAISIRKQKIHIHRLIASYILGGLKRDNYVHHIDENKLNSRAKNLLVMTASEHQSLTNKGRKQTPEWINKRITKTANAKRGKKYPKVIYENKDLLQ